MGAAISKSSVENDIVNSIITNIMMSSSQSCTSSLSAKQEIKIGDINAIGCTVNISGVSQVMDINQNFSCVNSTNTDSELQNKLQAELDQKLSAITKGQVFGYSNSDVRALNKLKNDVVNNVNMSSIASCVSSALSDQQVDISGITIKCRKGQSLNITSIKQELTMKQVTECINKDTKASKAINDFETKIKTVAEARAEGLDLTLMGGGISGVCCSFSVVIVLVMLILSNTVKDPAVQKILMES